MMGKVRQAQDGREKGAEARAPASRVPPTGDGFGYARHSQAALAAVSRAILTTGERSDAETAPSVAASMRMANSGDARILPWRNRLMVAPVVSVSAARPASESPR